MSPADPGSVTNLWGALASILVAALTVLGMWLVGRKDKQVPGHPVTVTAPDGSTRTHDATDPTAMVGIVEDLAEAVAAIPGMQTRLATQATQINALNDRVQRAESHAGDVEDDLDDLYEGLSSGRYPPLPVRKPRPEWVRPRRTT